LAISIVFSSAISPGAGFRRRTTYYRLTLSAMTYYANPLALVIPVRRLIGLASLLTERWALVLGYYAPLIRIFIVVTRQDSFRDVILTMPVRRHWLNDEERFFRALFLCCLLPIYTFLSPPIFYLTRSTCCYPVALAPLPPLKCVTSTATDVTRLPMISHVYRRQ